MKIKDSNCVNTLRSTFTAFAVFAVMALGISSTACTVETEAPTITNQQMNGTKPESIDAKTKPEVEESKSPEAEATKEAEEKENPKAEEKKDDNKEQKKGDDGVSKLKKEMPYAEARKILITAGWKPVKNNDIGEFGNERRMVDEFKYIEVEACSGTGMGFCLFVFKNADGRNLSVTTANNEEGQKGGSLVYGWKVSK